MQELLFLLITSVTLLLIRTTNTLRLTCLFFQQFYEAFFVSAAAATVLHNLLELWSEIRLLQREGVQEESQPVASITSSSVGYLQELQHQVPAGGRHEDGEAGTCVLSLRLDQQTQQEAAAVCPLLC